MDEFEKRITYLEIELNKLRDQCLHNEAIIESEKGTRGREDERIRVQIKASEDRFQKVIYNGDGLSLQVDRLKQNSDRAAKYFRENVSQIVDEQINKGVKYLWGTLIGAGITIIIGVVIFLLTKS